MAVATDYEKELKDLKAALAKGPVDLVKLPAPLRDPAFLEQAVAEGHVLFGRPEHSHERAPGIAESGAERSRRLVVVNDDKRIAWTALDQAWHKNVYELLAEDEETNEDGTPKVPAELRLKIKLARRKV